MPSDSDTALVVVMTVILKTSSVLINLQQYRQHNFCSIHWDMVAPRLPHLCCLCCHEKEEALEVQGNLLPPLTCPGWGGLILRREQDLTDTVLSLLGLLMVKIFLLHLFLHEGICRTGCPVLDFLLSLKSLRPKVCSWPVCTGDVSLSTCFFYTVSSRWIWSFWICLNRINGAVKKQTPVQRVPDAGQRAR